MISSEYSLTTGLFTGRRFAGLDADGLQANLLPGHAAIEGHFDHLSQQVSLGLLDESGNPVVVPYQPPSPPDDELQTWAWDDATKRWRRIPTIAAVAAAVRAERSRRMIASDWVTLRAVRTGTPVPSEWAAYLQALADVPEQGGFPLTVEWPTIPS